jgi:hypothetical protein
VAMMTLEITLNINTKALSKYNCCLDFCIHTFIASTSLFTLSKQLQTKHVSFSLFRLRLLLSVLLNHLCISHCIKWSADAPGTISLLSNWLRISTLL